jgi:hypothetical protein
MSKTNIVGQSQVMETADYLEDLRQQAIDTLNRYYQHSVELQAGGMLDGGAGRTNVVTAEEIQAAQMKIHARWELVIQALRGTSANAGEVDVQNASNIAAVSGGLRFT